jgi:hypothetical protein
VKEERREVEVEVDVVDPPRRTRALTRGMRRAAAPTIRGAAGRCGGGVGGSREMEKERR